MRTEDVIRTLRNTVLSSFSGASLQGLDFVDEGFGLTFCHYRQYNRPNKFSFGNIVHTLRALAPSPVSAVLLGAILRGGVRRWYPGIGES
jgi:hypothetical protein